MVHISYASLISPWTSSNLNLRWMLVTIILLFVCPLTSSQRGEHTIDDELVFSNHTGYVFHDSRGIECGGTEELETLRTFIRRRSEEKLLRGKLHAIWFVPHCAAPVFKFLITTSDGFGVRYCIPMDGHRPGLDLKFHKDICPDQNGALLQTFITVFFTQHFQVPIIAVFTKYDQFLRNVTMDVLDYPDKYLDRSVSEVANEQFQEHYLRPLGNDVGYVRLESEL